MSKSALPTSVNAVTDRRQPPWDSDLCVYCFERIVMTNRLGEDAHICMEMLLARKPAAPVPFN